MVQARESPAKVKVSNTHCFPSVHWITHIIVEGYQTDMAWFPTLQTHADSSLSPTTFCPDHKKDCSKIKEESGNISNTSTLVHDLNTIVLQASPKEKDTDTCWPPAWPPGQAEDAAMNRAEVSQGELWRVIWAGKQLESEVKKRNNKTRTCTRLQTLLNIKLKQNIWN